MSCASRSSHVVAAGWRTGRRKARLEAGTIGRWDTARGSEGGGSDEAVAVPMAKVDRPEVSFDNSSHVWELYPYHLI